MKKQTLFDLTSMPKMVLVIVMIVMLGTLFGATSYLLKVPKTDLSIVNPIVETQCEIDSDCLLVYVDDYVCLPWDTSVEKYKCLNSDEAKIFGGKKIDPSVLCSIPDVKFDKYICKCENGKCEKVKKELAEEVIITIDKMEYEQGEEVKITINNNSDKEQRISYPAYSIERFESNNWIEIKQIWCPCGAYCEEVEWLFIKSKDKLEYEWNQQESWCGDGDWSLAEEISKQVQSGKYRIKSIKIDLNNANNKQTIYSNEFTIKEKSALDARCGEEVIFSGNCERRIWGYEFDSGKGKCIVRNGSCNVKSPFKTLEECQDVCEKGKNCADNNDLVYASHVEPTKPSTCCDNEAGIRPLRQLLPNGLCQTIVPLDGAIGRCILKDKKSYIWGACGNGICDEDENKCNCPEDCK